MGAWTRRRVLGALGAGAACPAVSGFLAACGGRGAAPGAKSAAGEGAGAESAHAIRHHLRRSVERLHRRVPEASALARVHTRTSIAVDGSETTVVERRTAGVLFAARVPGAGGLEQATRDLSPAGIEAAARALEERVPGGAGSAGFDPGRPRSFRIGDPMEGTRAASILDRVRALYERARGAGGSRIVYRGAYLTLDRVETVFVGDRGDLAQEAARARAGVALLAWTGSGVAAEEAARAGTAGLDALAIEEAAIESAARRALDQIAVRAAPTGELELLLDPSVASLLAARGVAPALAGDLWTASSSGAAALAGSRIGSEHVSLVDDPSLRGGFASYVFDDEGWPAARAPLVERGLLAGPLTDRESAEALGRPRSGHGRRPGPLDAARPLPSNLFFAPGDLAARELVSRVERGLLLEGGLGVSADPRSWRATVRAARALEIRGGRETGRRYGQVVASGRIPELLGSVRGASRRVVWFPDQVGGLPIGRGAPYVLLRATVGEAA